MTERDRWISMNVKLVWDGMEKKKRNLAKSLSLNSRLTCLNWRFFCFHKCLNVSQNISSSSSDQGSCLVLCALICVLVHVSLLWFTPDLRDWRWHMLNWKNDEISELICKLWELNYIKLRAGGNLIPHNIAVIYYSHLKLSRLLLSAKDFYFQKETFQHKR